MANLIDLTGQRFGRLEVLEYVGNRKWKCLCDCGKHKIVDARHLKDGHSKSCGCLKIKYQITNKRIFDIWNNMKRRCDNPCDKDSKYYHDKGITYCDEWNMYEEFETWALNNGYSDNLTIDRIDGNLPYCPENCRWITIEEQQRNKSNNAIYEYKGVSKTLSEWAKEFNIPRETLRSRIVKLGYSFEKAISKPYGKQKTNVFIEYNGKQYTQTEFAVLANCTPQWVYQLKKRGLSAEQILEKTEKLRR